MQVLLLSAEFWPLLNAPVQTDHPIAYRYYGSFYTYRPVDWFHSFVGHSSLRHHFVSQNYDEGFLQIYFPLLWSNFLSFICCIVAIKNWVEGKLIYCAFWRIKVVSAKAFTVCVFKSVQRENIFRVYISIYREGYFSMEEFAMSILKLLKKAHDLLETFLMIQRDQLKNSLCM